MVTAEELVLKVRKIINDPEKIRNIAIAAHIDHGKTTLSDSLLAGAGLISKELAGTQLFMDFDLQEQERGITIYSANASMVHTFDGKEYLVNLIDTPGHVDFGGDVTRAMRAVDGVIVLVDAVEGVMPQTETVLRQALKERVKPVLFINKVDRFIRELKLNPEQMQERFIRHINGVNALIRKYAPEELKEKWLVDVNSGKVAFGSAYRKWGISIAAMKKKNITFKDIIELTNDGKDDELAKKSPVHEILLDMVVRHLPNPKEAQKYRVPKIWTGELETPEGVAMMSCDAKGTLVAVATKITADPHAGIISTVRIFSGTLRKGDEIFIVGAQKRERAQQIGIYVGPRRVQMEEIPAGNILAIAGLADATSGETICSSAKVVAPFEAIKHMFEPVVTKSIEPKNVKDLPKLIELLKIRSREDPTITIKVSQETGETLVSALGELHIDAKVERYLRDKGIDIVVSKPIVIYKESVLRNSRRFEGKSPNRHNKFFIAVAPLDKKVYDFLMLGELKEGKVRKQDQKKVYSDLTSAGMNKDEAKSVYDIYKGNLFLDMTRGIVALPECIEIVVDAFHEICDSSPLAGEPGLGLKIMLMDATLHEDSIHRGPAQVMPAVKLAARNAMVDGGVCLFEPKQILRIDCPAANMGNVIKEVQNRRGQVLDISEEMGMTIITVKLPVAEMFGFEAALKSATEGRGFESLVDIIYEKLPAEIQERTVLAIRKRKGMKEELPKIEEG